jgi:hypothetical protein
MTPLIECSGSCTCDNKRSPTDHWTGLQVRLPPLAEQAVSRVSAPSSEE